MSADPALVGSYLSRGGSALAGAAPLVAALSAPAGAAVALLGALAGIAGDVLQGPRGSVTHASDPGALLDAMREHWRAKRGRP